MCGPEHWLIFHSLLFIPFFYDDEHDIAKLCKEKYKSIYILGNVREVIECLQIFCLSFKHIAYNFHRGGSTPHAHCMSLGRSLLRAFIVRVAVTKGCYRDQVYKVSERACPIWKIVLLKNVSL